RSVHSPSRALKAQGVRGWTSRRNTLTHSPQSRRTRQSIERYKRKCLNAESDDYFSIHIYSATRDPNGSYVILSLPQTKRKTA
ncbi:hypothetical protein MTR67_018215, partial [Solanum verrucosum]